MKSQVVVTIIIIVMTIIVIWYINNKKVEMIETRQFNILNPWDSSKIISEIENKYMLWNKEGTRELEEQHFENYTSKLYKDVPLTLEKNKMIYFPSDFKVKWPMYYKTKGTAEFTKYFYPKPNSMLIATEDLEWEGKNKDKIVIIGTKNVSKSSE